jgi:hypothetical protein
MMIDDVTEKVLYPLAWHTPRGNSSNLVVVAAAVPQPTRERIVVALLPVILVWMGVTGLGHWSACA